MKVCAGLVGFISLAFFGSALADGHDRLTLVGSSVPPFIVGGDTVSGFVPELIGEAVSRLEIEHEFEMLPWKRAYERASRGPRTAHMFIARAKARENDFQWVYPLFQAETQFITNTDQVFDLETAKSAHQICVVQKTSMANFLKRQGYRNLLEVPDNRTCARVLSHGRVDAVFMGWFSLLHAFKEEGLSGTPLKKGPPILAVDVYLAASKDVDQATITNLQQSMKTVSNDGTFNAFLSRYGLKGLPAPARPTAARSKS